MNRYKILATLAAVTLATPLATPAEAKYSADSDTGIEALDYIENEHRTERENRLTAEQKQLVTDAKNFAASLRYPVDPEKGVPVAFEGDDLTYDENTGEFVAHGHVKILQADAHQFEGDEVTGNTINKEIHVAGAGRAMQMTEGQMPVTLNGYRMNYNYLTQTGDMEDAKGKAGHNYITARRFEFYPDHYVAYDATFTKCGAQKSDYHWGAEKITVYPNDKAIFEKTGFYIRGKKIFGRDRYVENIDPNNPDPPMPRVDYDSDRGVYMSYPLNIPVAKNVELRSLLEVNEEYGWRSHYDLGWSSGGLSLGVMYGHYADDDDNWIKREPSGYINYSRPLGKTHITYKLSAEYGRWYGANGNGIHSTHRQYDGRLYYDPIKFGKYALHLYGGYGVIRESYNDSRNAGWNYGGVLVGDFDDRWGAYAGYHYSYDNSTDSLFAYNTDDYSKKLEGGFSYRIDDLNRIAVGTKYDLDHKKWDDIDYYWYHDMHCAQFIARYRSMHNHWNIDLQFIPW